MSSCQQLRESCSAVLGDRISVTRPTAQARFSGASRVLAHPLTLLASNSSFRVLTLTITSPSHNGENVLDRGPVALVLVRGTKYYTTVYFGTVK